MGIDQITWSIINSEENANILKRFSHSGLVTTASSDNLTTDSAASATSMATGIKTKNNFLGIDANEKPLKNLFEIAREKNYATGFVVTSSALHATPAAFYAKINDRSKYYEIAEQLTNSKIDFFVGGGSTYFNEKNLTRLKEQNYSTYFDLNDFITNHGKKDKVAFFAAKNHLPRADSNNKEEQYLRQHFLNKTSASALQFLSNKSNKNFILLIEGSQIDFAGHRNDLEYLEAEMNDFFKSIKIALDFAKKDGNTLVILTADHETGAFSLGAKKNLLGKYGDIKPHFSTTGHSASIVPVFAFGPNSEKFSGLYDNSKIFNKINETLQNSH